MHQVEFISREQSYEIRKNLDSIIEIDGLKCETLDDYYDEIYGIFGFPKYSYNYDAYIDWMRDDYFTTDEVIFIITNEESFLKNYPDERKMIIDIFNEDIIPYWEEYLVKKNGRQKPKQIMVYFVK